MVRTFLVAVRASTAIAVQICGQFESVGFCCVRALGKLPKARHELEAATKDSFEISRGLEQSSVLLSRFAETLPELAACNTLAREISETFIGPCAGRFASKVTEITYSLYCTSILLLSCALARQKAPGFAYKRVD